jgi:hypothetical protein
MQQKETIGKKCAVHELFASKERQQPFNMPHPDDSIGCP